MKNCLYCGKEVKKKQQKYCNKYCFKNELKKGNSAWRKQINNGFKNRPVNEEKDDKNNQ